MAEYSYRIMFGHIIADVEGQLLLIDTGAPASIGADIVVISGNSYSVQKNYLGVTAAYLSEQIGAKIDGLIGADVIQDFVLTVDPVREKISFDSQTSQFPIIVSIEDFMGIPIVTVTVNESDVRAFFDTGAQLSYIDSQFTKGIAPSGQREDFYPGIGRFSTDIFQLNTKIGGEHLIFTYGNLPDLLQLTLMMADTQAIIGTELLKTHAFSLSISNRELRLKRI